MQWYLHSYFARQNRTSAAFNYQSSAILFNGLLSSCNVNKLSFSSFKLATNESKLFFVFNAGKPLKTQGTKFFGICRILWCKKDVPKKTLDAFIHFHTLSYALEGFTYFHMLSYAFISSPTLSYTLFYTFICFHMLFIRFSYAFICFSYTFIRF